MDKIQIAVLVGSLRRDSINLRLAKAVEKLSPARFVFSHVRIDDLPLYSQELEADYPPQCRRLKQEVQAADALLFVTPEYNRSIPGALKNALDIGSRPSGANSFGGKPAAMLGASPGSAGTAMAQQHLRNILAYLDVALLAQPEACVRYSDELIGSDGAIGNEHTRKYLQQFVDRYAAWIRQLC